MKINKKWLYFGSMGLIGILLIIYIILSVTYKTTDTIHELPHTIDPVAFRVFGREVRWYAICILSGACAVAFYGYYGFYTKVGFDSDTLLEGFTWGLIAGILGARIYYVIFNPASVSYYFEESFFKGLFMAINPTGGGLAIHGAIYGAIIMIIIHGKVRKYKILEMIEIVLPCFMLAQVVGRWGNFFNHEAYGPLVNGYTDLILSDAQLLAQRETLRHLLVPNFIIDQMYITATDPSETFYGVTGYFYPTFFFEGCINFIAAFGIILARKYTKKLYIGDGVLLYFLSYGVTRFFIELLRQDPLYIPGTSIRIAVLTSIIYVVVSIVLLILRRVFKFHMVSSHDFLYGEGTIWTDKKFIKKEDGEVKNNG